MLNVSNKSQEMENVLMDTKLKSGDQLKNFMTIAKNWGFIT